MPLIIPAGALAQVPGTGTNTARGRGRLYFRLRERSPPSPLDKIRLKTEFIYQADIRHSSR